MNSELLTIGERNGGMYFRKNITGEKGNNQIWLLHKKGVSFLYEKIKITPVFMANIFISGV
jgi:hypothetical protein